MCNIAGYVGTKDAAPILAGMIKRQEGYAGGYFTGLATLHEGKISYAKLTGDTDKLLRDTNALQLPGNIGIAHSRSKSGGGDEWAHPFVGIENGKEKIAYIANGAVGYFSALKQERYDLTNQLYNEGYTMLSRVALDKNGDYPALADGTKVHMSDVMCQLILKHMETTPATSDAMEKAFCQMPSEIVGLLLSLTEPNAITWCRINMPVFVAFASHGVYLASTPLAFPEDAGEYTLLPVCSSGLVYADHYTVKPFAERPAKIAQIDAKVFSEAYAKVCELIKDEPKTLGFVTKAIQELFEEADCQQKAPLAYQILYSLNKQGLLKVEEVRVPGAFEHLDAPEFRISLK